MGLKNTRGKSTTGSLSYCPYWSDCGTIASYCRAIAAPARQPSFPYSLIRVIPSLLTAAPLPSPVRNPTEYGAAPLRAPSPSAGNSQAPVHRPVGREKRGKAPRVSPQSPAPNTRIQNTNHSPRMIQSLAFTSSSLGDLLGP